MAKATDAHIGPRRVGERLAPAHRASTSTRKPASTPFDALFGWMAANGGVGDFNRKV
jgi:hypothetical protein